MVVDATFRFAADRQTEIPASNRLVVATDRSPEASVLAARDALDERLASNAR